MKKSLMALGTALMLGGTASAQKVTFEEFDLDNGLHVVLHQDNSAPVVITSVMYHVGAKDEQPNRTGFAHFFEHLLFEHVLHLSKCHSEQIPLKQMQSVVSLSGLFYFKLII